MKIRLTRIQIVEVKNLDIDDSFEPDIHAVADSLQDDILNAQDSEHETDDSEFVYTPREIISFKVERVEE